jgi:ribosomal protein L22
MSARIPSRRLGQSALAAFRSRSQWTPTASLTVTTRRNLNLNPFSQKKEADLSNPILEEYLKKKEIESKQQAKLGKPEKAQPQLRQADVASSTPSLLSAERELPGWRENMTPAEVKALQAQTKREEAAAQAKQSKHLMDMTLDPDKKARLRLERKLVISGVKRHGRMTKAQKIARTERESLFKSHLLPTSTKKLQKVVNQIAGKTISEALVQLRFSKKKVARDVIKGLEIAQNEAIAARGMGLSGEQAAVERWTKQRTAQDFGKARDIWDYKTSAASGKGDKEAKPTFFKDTTIELKDGKKKLVRDPSEIYIDQAWVGPGESWKTPEFRARGAINMLKHRTTSFSVLLKEEKTRMRISDEIKKKRDNRKLWVALPDRPVTSQRQYCLW